MASFAFAGITLFGSGAGAGAGVITLAALSNPVGWVTLGAILLTGAVLYSADKIHDHYQEHRQASVVADAQLYHMKEALAQEKKKRKTIDMPFSDRKVV